MPEILTRDNPQQAVQHYLRTHPMLYDQGMCLDQGIDCMSVTFKVDVMDMKTLTAKEARK
jgi:cephalosporin hydroxylase